MRKPGIREFNPWIPHVFYIFFIPQTTINADNRDMHISNDSLNDPLACLASNLSSDQVQLQLAVAVMKQIQEQQEAQAAGLLKMIHQTQSLNGTGRRVDVSI
jgi:hypothetical protein